MTSSGAGGSALRARSGSVDVILEVTGSHGRLEERSGMVSLAFEMAPQLPCNMGHEAWDMRPDWRRGRRLAWWTGERWRCCRSG